MASLKRKSSSPVKSAKKSKLSLWTSRKRSGGAEAKPDALGAATSDLTSMGFQVEVPELKVEAKDAKVSDETRILYAAVKAVHSNTLALARLHLSLSKKLSHADPAALWTKYRERILKAARRAMGAQFVNHLDDFYKLDAAWKESTITDVCFNDPKISADMARCNDPADFLTLATSKASAVLNTTKSNLRALVAEIVAAVPELRTLIRDGFVGQDGEELGDDDEPEPVRDAETVAHRMTLAVKARLRERLEELGFNDSQVDKFVAHIGFLREQVDAAKAPKWLWDKMQELGAIKDSDSASASVLDE